MAGMWMGPRGHETWVPAPAAGGGLFTPVGYSTKTQYLNGGAGGHNSLSTHMEYNFVWNLKSRSTMRPVTDMFQGVRGPGLIYFVDPMAADQNVLPQSWAFPAQACYDAVPLAGTVRPQNVATLSNTLNYPAESARYEVVDGTPVTKVYVPIPPGFIAWVGVHGQSNGAQMTVTTIGAGNVTGDTRALAMLSVTDDLRFSDSFTGQGIELSWVKDSSTTEPVYPSQTTYPSGTSYPSDGISDYMTISGLMVQILPVGVTPERGDFISGQGHSGCKFDGAPAVTPYSAALDMVGVTAKLFEAGSYL